MAERAANGVQQVSLADAVRQAIAYHHAGKHAEAERVYRAVLAVAPDHFDALHLLGVLCAQGGHPGEGAMLLARAVTVQPQAADAQANLANVLKSLGRLEDALRHCELAIAHKPGHAGILNIRASLLLDLQRFADAVTAADAVLAVDPSLPDAHYHRGVALQAQGRFADALASYDRALSLEPRLAAAHNNRANVLRMQGRLSEAHASAVSATSVAPTYTLAWNTRAGVEHALGRHADALASADRALALRRDMPEALRVRGAALKDLGRFADALASLDRALAVAPGHTAAMLDRGFTLLGLDRASEALAVFERVLAGEAERIEALYGRAAALQHAGRLDDALAAYDVALQRMPDFVAARNGRAGVLRAIGRLDDALAAWSELAAAYPALPEIHHNVGSALFELGRHGEAVAAYDRALAVRPDYKQALHNRAAALSPLMRFTEALASCDALLAIDPDNADAYHNRGSALSSLNRFAEAVEAYGQALARKPDAVATLQNRASVLAYLGRHDEAAREFAKVLAIDPGYPYQHGAMLASRLHCCDWGDYASAVERLEANALAGLRVSDPFPMVMTTGNALAQLACARTFAQDKHPGSVALWMGERLPHERIRVAYLSADFHEHATAYLMSGLFERHDRGRFETIAVSLGPVTGDAMQQRLARAFDRFVDVHAMSDRDIARVMREMEIDIAVDLKGYTFDSRPAILAHRPAPIQVNYLGYPGTMGAPYIDYIVADDTIIPEADRPAYVEQVVTLPGSYQPNDASRVIAAQTPTREAEGLPAQGFVFCSFNSSYKITPPVFDIWMRLLAAVPGSVLWLLEGNSISPGNLRKEAAARGVDPARIVFASRREQSLHLARHRLADLFLDTLPVNAHTTASDALWAGLPVVTCIGTTFAGRVAASLLRAAGLADLVTTSLAEYEALALALAQDPARHADARRRLAAARDTCALFDTDATTRHLERAFAHMWARHARGERPAAFAVAVD